MAVLRLVDKENEYIMYALLDSLKKIHRLYGLQDFRIKALEDDVTRLTEALEVYAKQQNWHVPDDAGVALGFLYRDETSGWRIADDAMKSRQALEGEATDGNIPTD